MAGKTWIIIFLFLGVISVNAACGRDESPPQLIAEAGSFTGTLEITPYPPVPMQDTTFQIVLADAGQPVRGAHVKLTLTMPECTMAPSFLELSEKGENVYSAQTILTMAGTWRVDANVAFVGRNEVLTFFFSTR